MMMNDDNPSYAIIASSDYSKYKKFAKSFMI